MELEMRWKVKLECDINIPHQHFEWCKQGSKYIKEHFHVHFSLRNQLIKNTHFPGMSSILVATPVKNTVQTYKKQFLPQRICSLALKARGEFLHHVW